MSQGRHARLLHRERGFTLFETLIAAGLLAMAAGGILSLQRDLFSRQTTNRDRVVGLQLQQQCAEKLLATRRNGAGYAAIDSATICSGLGGYGFGAPGVVLRDAANSVVTSCSSASCTATISITKGSSSLPALTLQLSNY
ncbi:type IV pilus modification PilV family protein [Roseateles violae]|uniref:Prepilin-type N-terminal cleavage/methylation domain-containing protein n=1 Tax=Roseateles violae TaxID=3058042 RepID=A0ABT8DXS0_9BURK|nr:prepilin-type N-terminal cleavage/methylation domain-containing protein [Pelomonas sp. PFR6]MDN3921689.1 prepilin-type N-terminal cleavage/methylation domain-containing protein [Pelomonas sp. PFR6]